MPAVKVTNEPLMQQFMLLMKSDPEAAKKIDERAQELLNGELSDSLYNWNNRVHGGQHHPRSGEQPMQTALKMAMQEYAQTIARPTSSVPSFAPGQGIQPGTGQIGRDVAPEDQRAGQEASADLRGLTLTPPDEPKLEDILTLDKERLPASVQNNMGFQIPLGKDFEIQTQQQRLDDMAGEIDALGLEPGVIDKNPEVTALDRMAEKIDAKGGKQTEMIRGQSLPQGNKLPNNGSLINPIPLGKDVDIVGSGGGGNGLLSALGKLAGNDAALQALGIGAQGIGALMQGRAQNKADKRTSKQQSVNNAIAAFTGGQAQQAAPRRGTSTGGGILSAIGQGLGGYGQTRAAQRQQEVENAQVDAGLQQKRDHDETLENIARLQMQGKKGGETEDPLIDPRDAQTIKMQLEKLRKLHDNGSILSTGTLADGFLGSIADVFSGERTRLAVAATSLTAPIKELFGLGRLSDKDFEIIERSLPVPGMSQAQVDAAIASLKDYVELRSGGLDANTAASKLQGGGTKQSGAKAAAKAAYDRGDFDEAERIMDEAGV